MKTTLACKGCEAPSRSRRQLENHEKNCPRLRMGTGQSFFTLLGNQQQRNSAAAASSEKILPLSQPLNLPAETSNNTDPLSTNAVHSEATGQGSSGPPTITRINPHAAPNIQSSQQNTNYAGHRILQTDRGRTAMQTSQSSDVPGREDVVNEDVLDCPICKIEVMDGVNAVNCGMCHTWVHQACLHMSDSDFEALGAENIQWYCARCHSIKANNLKWGNVTGEANIRNVIATTVRNYNWMEKEHLPTPKGKMWT